MATTTDKSPTDLFRDDDNDLQTNYTLHDYGEAYFSGRMDQLGYSVEKWGIDQRDDDSDQLIYDDKMDLRIWDTDGYIDLRGITDIKTKSSERWLGIFNERHLVKYTKWADIYDCPVFVFFTLVDRDNERVGHQNIVVPIEPWQNYKQYVKHYQKSGPNAGFFLDNTSTIVDDCPFVERTFGAGDKNRVVVIDDEHYHGWDWVESALR